MTPEQVVAPVLHSQSPPPTALHAVCVDCAEQGWMVPPHVLHEHPYSELQAVCVVFATQGVAVPEQ